MLVNCVAYQDGRKIGDIAVEDIHTYVSRPNCFVWVALCDPAPDELEHLQDEFDLHPLAVEDARHGHQRPKIEEYGSSLFAVLHMVEIRDGDAHVGDVAIFVGERYVLSVRRDASRGFADVRARTEQEVDLLRVGPGYVLYALMDSVVDRYFPVIATLEEETEEVEARIFSGDTTREQIEALFVMKRKLSVIAHAVGPLLEATGKLQAGRVPPVCAGLADYFRDVYDHLTRLDQSIDHLREMVATAITVNLSLITLQESQTSKRLAAYAALFAVPTMIAGLYGMNFAHMPELNWTFGYPLSLALMGGIDLYLFFRFRRARWL
jgi:magnesium transporter